MKSRRENALHKSKILSQSSANSKAKTMNILYAELQKIKKKMRSTDPLAINCMTYLLYNLNPYHINNLKDLIKEKYEGLEHFFKESDKKISNLCAKKIKNGMKILILENSKEIKAGLKKAKEQGKSFVIDKKANGTLQEYDIILIGSEKWPSTTSRQTLKSAANHEIPTYMLTNSHAYTSEFKNCKKIISELGILEPKYFIEEARKNYPWLVS